MSQVPAKSNAPSQAGQISQVPINPAPKNSHGRLFVLLSLLILSISLSVAGFIYFEQLERGQKQKSNTVESFVYPKASANIGYIKTSPSPLPFLTPTQNAKTLTDLPYLFPGLEWKLTKSDDLHIKGFNVIYITSDDQTIFSEEYKLDGTEWTSERRNVNDDDNVSDEFSTFYETEFTKIGWDQEVRMPGYRVQAISADGPTGSTWGYIGVIDDKLRAVVLDQKWELTDKPECPCDFKYSVFLSDVIPVSQILE